MTCKRTASLFSIGCSTLLILTVAPADQANEQSPAAATGIYGQSGYRAYIDPESGRLAAPTKKQLRKSPLRHSPLEVDALSGSHEGLHEEQIPGRKGFKMDLQGRFQSGSFATVNESGHVVISHDPAILDDSDSSPKTPGTRQREELNNGYPQ